MFWTSDSQLQGGDWVTGFFIGLFIRSLGYGG